MTIHTTKPKAITKISKQKVTDNKLIKNIKMQSILDLSKKKARKKGKRKQQMEQVGNKLQDYRLRPNQITLNVNGVNTPVKK